MVLLTPTKAGVSVSPSSLSPWNSATFQLSIWLSGVPRREVHVIWKCSVEQSWKPLGVTLLCSASCLEAAPQWPNCTREPGRWIQPAAVSSLRQLQQCTREGRRAGDLLLQQFATLVLHPAVNYVPFSVTIRANGCRADGNTKMSTALHVERSSNNAEFLQHY